MNTTLRKIGNSTGVIIPKDVLDRLNLKEGDELALVEDGDGVRLVKTDETFNRQMEAARVGMKQYHNALAKLAK